MRTESEIDREIGEYRKKKEKEQEDLFDLDIDSRSVSAEEAQSQIRIDPEQVAEYLKKIVKDDRIVSSETASPTVLKWKVRSLGSGDCAEKRRSIS